MVSETICIDIIRALHGNKFRGTVRLASSEHQVEEDNAATDADIYPALLGRFSLSAIDSAARWLLLCAYIREGKIPIVGLSWYVLTEKGIEAADVGRILEEDRALLYHQEDPYAVFVAHQFNEDDTELVTTIREQVLTPAGFKMLEGRADGLEQFRESIIKKIRESRFFLCLLTARTKLEGGGFASSVWLYQETGVAVAFDKSPLLLVEENLDSQYVGELTSVYEHVPFTRSNHPRQFQSITRRLLASLDAHGIPKPAQQG
jgi:hypothetical protein